MRRRLKMRHETWLLAAIVWLAGCAAIWFILAVRPTAIIPADQGGESIRFSADGRTILTREYGTSDPDKVRSSLGGFRDRFAPEGLANGPYHLLDAQTGSIRHTWTPSHSLTRIASFSPDGCWAVVSEVSEVSPFPGLCNLATDQQEDVPWSYCEGGKFSADGRYLVANSQLDGG